MIGLIFGETEFPKYILKKIRRKSKYLIIDLTKKKIFKKDKNSSINFSFELFNTGQYEFKENSLFFNDSLKFREKSYKRHLDRNTMILKSKYKEKVVFEHFCEVTDLIKFRIKYTEIINNLKKFWKNKFKDNKI